MYNYFSLVTFTLNTSGGAEIVSEKLTKEVDGVVVPCNKAESELKLHDKISKVGGNKATQNIKCVLFNPNGDIIKIDEVEKETVTE
jgi:hypothetical protein